MAMDIGLDGLLQIIGELEVNRRVLKTEVENLENQLAEVQQLAEPKGQDAEDNVQAPQD